MARSAEVPTRRSHGRREIRRWDPTDSSSGPWGLMRQMQDQMERWFASMSRVAGSTNWTPAVDAFRRGNEFVIRVDAPGMNRHDLSVDVGDDSVTIRGERKHEEHGDDEGIYWSERGYGTFCRDVPLPPGAIADSAKATFSNGVLEITMQAPSPETRRGRKVDISGSGG